MTSRNDSAPACVRTGVTRTSAVALVLALVGCAAPDGPATLVIEPVYGEAAPGGTISIGGYGLFVTVRDADGNVVPGSGLAQDPIRFDQLIPGSYTIAGRIAAASDAISCVESNGQRECQKSYGPTVAECSAEIELAFEEFAYVRVMTQGQEFCVVSRTN